MDGYTDLVWNFTIEYVKCMHYLRYNGLEIIRIYIKAVSQQQYIHKSLEMVKT